MLCVFDGCKYCKVCGVCNFFNVDYRTCPAKPHGPGTHLRFVLKRFRLAADSSCKCAAHETEMNLWGCEACEQHLEEIVGWLREEAAARKLPYLDVAGKMLVRLAISNARREAKRAKSTA